MSQHPEVGTTVARTAAPSPRQALMKALEKAQPAISAVAAAHMSADRLLKVTLLAATQQPKLLQCDPKTIVASVIKAAEMGLEVGGGFGHAYLVPYNNRKLRKMDCQLIVGYQGYIELALRTNRVLDISSVCVYEGDHFEYHEGTDRRIVHTPNLDAERTWEKLRYVYAVAILAGGVKKVEVMTKKEIDAVRKRGGNQQGGPWDTDTLEMAKKSPVRRMQKYLPKTRELATAIQLDELSEGVGEASVLDIMNIDGLEEEPVTATAKLAERLGADAGQSTTTGEPGDDLALDRELAKEE